MFTPCQFNLAKIIYLLSANCSLQILRFLSHRISPKEFLVLTLSGDTTQRDELMRGFWELLELTGEGMSKNNHSKSIQKQAH